VFAGLGTINTSDGRLKKDITTSDLGLDFINKLNPVHYKWKDENLSTQVHYGFIAQEVEKVLGTKDIGMVNYSKEYDRYGLNYTQFISPLVKAVQEEDKKVEDLAVRCEMTQEQMAKIDVRVTELEKKVSTLESENKKLKNLNLTETLRNSYNDLSGMKNKKHRKISVGFK
jgi:hypothetical protein